MSTEESEIVDYFENRSVFLTGGTGFVGKALAEKLLRVCPKIKSIYVLVRPKRGLGVQERIEELIRSSVFDAVRRENPNVLRKLVPVAGDITSRNLGISLDDQEILHDQVSVVIHAAATVKFDEVMSLSADINVGGVQRVLELARNMKHISAVIHISTAYSNCEKKHIQEMVYPVSFDPAVAIKTFSWLGEKVLRKITPELLGDKPNTYAYTKSLAEYLVQTKRADLPVSIVRPSIVTAGAEEPMPGWVDNMQGGSGILVAHGKGLLGATEADGSCLIDFIPVDYLVNLIVTAAWNLATSKSETGSSEVVVYNCCSGQWNPVEQKQLQKYLNEAYLETPFNDLFRFPRMELTRFSLWSRFHNFLVIFLPSVLVDLVARMRGRQPGMLKLYRKVQAADRAIKYFRTNDWNFSCENMKWLWNKMNAKDQKLFNFNVDDINWRTYSKNYINGLRKYTLKEDDSTLEKARRRLRRIVLIYSWIRILSFLLLAGFSVKIFKLWMAHQLRRLIFS